MAIVSPRDEAAIDLEPDNKPGIIPPDQWFDRSSVTADVMVTLEGVTEAQWWQFAPEGRVCEYLDGVVYMPSPATDDHQDEVGFWHILVDGFLEETNAVNLGVRLGPGVLRLAPGRNLEPDLFIVPLGDGPHDSPAVFVVETLSKSTRSHDLKRKLQVFQDAGIPEIVYVDLQQKQIISHRKNNDLYETEILSKGIWRSSALPGFWLDVEWLWQTPLPSRRRCLTAILAGPPR